jgi:hypothetical protein
MRRAWYHFWQNWQRGTVLGKTKGRTFVRPRGDEVKYAFTEALRRATRPTWGRCPSRAASKTSMPTLNGQRNRHFIRLPIQTLFPQKSSNILKAFSAAPRTSYYAELTVWLQVQKSKIP